ncbi:signal transduction histidine kinase [Paraburkholderia sp. GAS199]|uniref:ATP-binding protein n=1 Tax=Paraburkholderia sp. GAS199 TaxID=3035126 RepID=UPI003D1AED7D
MNPTALLHAPRTLFARLVLILFVSLALVQSLSVWLTRTERDQTMTNVMMGYIESEVTSSVALLDHLPPAERAAWLPRLARRTYTFILGPGVTGAPPDVELSARVAQSIADGIGKRYALTVNAVPGDPDRLQVHLQLSDGTPLTIDYHPVPSAPLSPWLSWVLVLQLVVLVACCWLAVRLATRPLSQLARAADTLGPDLQAERLPEDGPDEVARAARAFNAMQDRIKSYMTERLQILASISHDLQTPITRMRLRLDVLDDSAQGAKLQQDLHEMETMVKEGVTYARTLHGASEAPLRIDPDALVESLVFDYVDAGKDVSLSGRIGAQIVTRPQALRRIVGNLVDNALKFGGSAEIAIAASEAGQITLSVLDRGPGIPAGSLDAVFEPFVRLEESRNRGTGGTGLGLAIARQLALAIDATLSLHNRPDGGLEARLVLKRAA